MTVKLRQIAALLLAASICIGSVVATGTEGELAQQGVPADTTQEGAVSLPEEVGSEVAPEETTEETTEETMEETTEETTEETEQGDVSQEDTQPESEPAVPEEEVPEIYDPYGDTKLRIGLAYPGSSAGALVAANLLNADVSAVTGYRFGYYDQALEFVSLESTEETAVTMVKTTNVYRQGENYSDTPSVGDYEVLGCYHLQLPGSYTVYEEAKNILDMTPGSFLGWVNGEYFVRKGAYATYDEAKQAADAAAEEGWSVCYTSVYAINVVKTGTNQILFQFDGGAGTPLGVMPGLESNEGAATWFKGYKYQGGFRYERVGGENIVVVNVVDVDTYVKGVVPYESNKLWPLETLKAQALCAKNYALINLNKHNGYNFDLCTTTECQVYYGLGSNKESFQPSALSDQAVDEIRGIYVWYQDRLAQTYFYSSNGGGSEDSSKVWGSKQENYPYLLGVVDPYEATVADSIPNYTFSNTFTCAQLTEILRSKGYATNTEVVDFQVTEYSKSGNVLTMKFIYANGKSNTFASASSSWLRNKLGCRSMHFTVTGAGDMMSAECTVNDGTGANISDFAGLYAISATGTVAVLEQSVPYVITGDGEISMAGQSSGVPDGTFVVSGAGWGHNVGYSQWGGYAMAKLGYTCEEIIEFYYTGVEVGAKQSDEIENIGL